jgi:hypothetical protein
METSYSSFAILGLHRSRSGIQTRLIDHRVFEGEPGLRLCATHPLEPKMVMLDNGKLVFKDLKTGELATIAVLASIILSDK